MSQPKVQPSQPLNVTMEQVTNFLGQVKRRLSQRKGELSDNLSDQITQELSGINQMCLQLFSEIQRLQAELDKLTKAEEPKKK